MKISTLMLAEHVTITNGLINVLNGNATRLGRPVFPAALDLHLVCLVDMPTDFVGHTPVHLNVEVKRVDSGQKLAETGGDFSAALREGADPHTLTATLTIDLRPVPIPSPGPYVVSVRIDDGETYDRYFEVVSSAEM